MKLASDRLDLGSKLRADQWIQRFPEVGGCDWGYGTSVKMGQLRSSIERNSRIGMTAGRGY